MKQQIVGLDFSGASDAGRRIWIAETRPARDGIEILSCRPAAELPGGAVERAPALAALRGYIAGLADAIIGCDFPFSLPREVIAHATWTEFIADFTHSDAAAFAAHCRRLSPGREPKRLTDREAKTPWCAFNIRLYRQSFHGMAEVLRPLAVDGKAVVLPMQAPAPNLPWLIETCPASALRHFGWRGSYKGPGLSDQRRKILSKLAAARLLRPLPASIAKRLIADSGGDALDSVIAALATAAALGDIGAGDGGGDPLEGRVYFRLRQTSP